MTDFTKLVRALRCCEFCDVCDVALDYEECPFGGRAEMEMQAAAAIETLQAEVDKANKSADAYRAMYFTKHGDITIEKVRELDEIDCHFHSALIRLMYKRIEELEAKNKELHGRIEEKELQIDMLTADNTNCDIAIDKLKAQLSNLKKRNAELHAELEKWVSAAEKAGEPKRGKWIGVSPMVDTVQCSICGGQLFSAELETPYCPYCGAEMIGEQNVE